MDITSGTCLGKAWNALDNNNIIMVVMHNEELHTYRVESTDPKLGDTFGDLFSWLEERGFTAYIENGQIHIIGGPGSYVTYVGENIGSFINYGEGVSWEIGTGPQTVTINGTTQTVVTTSTWVYYTGITEQTT